MRIWWVRPVSSQQASEGGHRAEPLDDAVMSHGVAALPGPARDTPPKVAAVGHQRQVDRALGSARRALDDGQVLPLDVVRLEQRLEGADGPGRARQRQRAGGALVEPMDDPDERPPAAVADRQVAPGPLDQGVALVVECREGQQPGGLVDDQDVAILVEHAELARDGPRLGAVREVGDGGLGLDLASRLVAAVARHVDPPVAHRLLRGPARQAEPLGDQFVKTDRHVIGCIRYPSLRRRRPDGRRRRRAAPHVSRARCGRPGSWRLGGLPVHDGRPSRGPRRPESRRGPWVFSVVSGLTISRTTVVTLGPIVPAARPFSTPDPASRQKR